MLDEYLIGDYVRNSPEADVPIIDFDQSEHRLGGAANVALNLQSLDLSPILISLVGEDESGKRIVKHCKEKGIQNHFIIVPKRKTTKKQRIVDRDFKQYLRVDYEDTVEIESGIENQLLTVINNELLTNDIKGIVLQDYNKGLFTPTLIKSLLELAEEKSIPTFADPKHLNFELLAQATVFKPNLKELTAYLGNSNSEVKISYDALKNIELDLGKMLFVTLAEAGIFYRDISDIEDGLIAGFPITDPDVSGAGDTVLATLVMTYLRQPKVAYMAEIANKAGAIVCAKKGISLVTREELSQFAQ